MHGRRVKARIGAVRWIGPIVLLAAPAVTAGAGGGGATTGHDRAAGDAPPPARLAVASGTKRPRQILVRADASPASHGPFALDGRYVARFEQVAPEDPELDFATQTAFVATFDRK